MFKTKEEALKRLIETVDKAIKKASWGNEQNTKKAITSFISAVTSSNNLEDIVKEFKLEISKRDYSGYIYSMGSYSDTFLCSSKGKNDRQEMPRLFVKVGNEVMHVFSLRSSGELEPSEYLELAQTFKEIHFVNELVYEYLVYIKSYDLASKVLELELKNSKDFNMKSDYVRDFIPMLSVMSSGKKKFEEKIKSRVLKNYLDSFYSFDNHEKEIIDFNNKVFKDFKTHLKKLNYSRFEVSATSADEEGELKNVIDPMDLMESSISYRRELLSFGDWESTKLFRQMAEKDKSRLERIIANHLNSEFPNGVRKSSFVRMYRKIRKNMEIDVFKLDPKLQSYVLLEEIS